MTYFRLMAVALIGLSVSACGTMQTATRNVPLDHEAMDMATPAPSYDVAGVRVTVPATLEVSEANRYYPSGDIVWRGDARGNRHEQVKAIFEQSADLGLSGVAGAMPVEVEIVVRRFHALTEKTRYTVGGVHSITFDVTLRDPASGAILRGPREIRANLEGYGGQQAVEAEAKGLTQKYRITQHLARVIREELTQASGYVSPAGGITRRVEPVAPLVAQDARDTRRDAI
ncbi:hypothetical protein SAMN04490248_106145 [Salinihabitans flavidus]|uniref:Lipoprotein n=1 Tax=Salinihabitans flavidus TaxID=569882 RepID=A0A1H8QFJ2_9RHOB|nr:DUF6778 family protein [Salinihabitans flavidus]SEO52982.1 hypothetical protein SAMN04490248_106145 [Salinihabitans flavidus]